ncbi:MAG: N-acetylglucosamine-6-phosphate deacetylase, partial [Armatimonadota bacterium]
MLIANGCLITPDEIIPGGGIIIQEGKIAGVLRADKSQSQARSAARGGADDVLDAGGRLVVPGFIDLHLQGTGDVDVWEGTYEAVDALSRNVARYGTTSFTGATHYRPEAIEAICEAVRRGTSGANVLGLYMEGPFISPRRRGAISPKYCLAPTQRELDRLLEKVGSALKVMTVAPEVVPAEMIARLVDAAVVPAVGHSDATYEQVRRAADAGVCHATHLFNAMRGVAADEPGTVGACLLDERISVELIADGIHLHPGALRLVRRVKQTGKICLITDAVRAAGMQEGAYASDAGGRAVTVRNGAVRLEDGTLAGSTLTMNRAVRNMIRLAGCSIQEAVRMASTSPAAVLGLSDRKGMLKAGMDADIVIADDDLQVHAA